MYSNVVLNVFKNPKNTGRISKPDGIASCFNEDNTAHVEFSLRIEGGVITNCQFRAQANPYIIAICSTITNMVKGKLVPMLFLDPYSIKKELGDEANIDIGFCIDCVKMAIDDYKEKLGKTVKDNKKQSKKQSTDSEEIIEEETIAQKTETAQVFDEMNEQESFADVSEDIQEKNNKTEEATETNSDDDESSDNFDDDFDFSDFFDDEEI